MADELTAYAADYLYEAVLRLFRGKPRGRILDIPSGQGAFAKELLDLGYSDLVCVDINEEDFKLKGKVEFLVHDINSPLPFASGSFDDLFCLEGLEHLKNPYGLVEELCRVLKPGGFLYISTPNIMSVDGRFKFLLTGYFPRFKDLMKDRDNVRKEGLQAHIFPIYFWQLKYFLENGGVEIRRLAMNEAIRHDRPMRNLLQGLFKYAIRHTVTRRHFPDEGTLSDAMLMGDCLIIEAQKGT